MRVIVVGSHFVVTPRLFHELLYFRFCEFKPFSLFGHIVQSTRLGFTLFTFVFRFLCSVRLKTFGVSFFLEFLLFYVSCGVDVLFLLYLLSLKIDREEKKKKNFFSCRFSPLCCKNSRPFFYICVLRYMSFL